MGLFLLILSNKQKMETKRKKPLIEDELLEPYFIQMSEDSYDVGRKIKDRTIILGYYSNVSNALKSIVTRKSKEVDGTIDLSGYIEKLEKLSNAILNLNVDIKNESK